jgi:hypothetical protein
MFCPKCGNQNLDEAQFCRSCGVNLSLVPQALTGQLPAAPAAEEPRRKRRREHTIGDAVGSFFVGLAFAAVALILLFQGKTWGVWMLLPALGIIGKGVGDYLQARHATQPTALPPAPPYAPPTALPARNTGELVPQPFSVTEATTHHLSHAEAPTRVFDPPARKPDEQ